MIVAHRTMRSFSRVRSERQYSSIHKHYKLATLIDVDRHISYDRCFDAIPGHEPLLYKFFDSTLLLCVKLYWFLFVAISFRYAIHSFPLKVIRIASSLVQSNEAHSTFMVDRGFVPPIRANGLHV